MKKASSSCSVAIECSWFYSHWKLITAALDTHIHFPLIFCMLLSSKSIPIQKHVKSKYLIYWSFLYNFLASFFTDRHHISNNSISRIYHTTLCLTYFVFAIVLRWHTAVQLDMFFFPSSSVLFCCTERLMVCCCYTELLGLFTLQMLFSVSFNCFVVVLQIACLYACVINWIA